MWIDGKTRLVGIIGQPVEHSRSPLMHNTAFQALGLNWCYVPLPVASDQVAAAVRGLVALGFAGANVTIPHKEAVLTLVDELDQAAATIGAVNTLVIKEGRIWGYNTDWLGVKATLDHIKAIPAGRRVLVLGAGGSARAVVYALAQEGAGEILVAARRPEAVGSLQTIAAVTYIPWQERALARVAAEVEIIINTTPLGMSPEPHLCPPLPPEVFGRQHKVFDLIYNPQETRLLARARSRGATTVNGILMLVEQGREAFRLWTGMEPPLEVMLTALGISEQN
ncbi:MULTISPECIES: shikimate dehydrogenase [unclassified Carboxydocella]|uniref:shikimate dehydrogenase n=1 Tax=unclassified Carboxydocella TaxID=2685367 RepID=UPI0009AEBDE8|nr:MULTISPECIES: shikimate dehydrogenase [unclassified Carboxydocella]AVX29837.1 shikimate dehydrogenase [Carboxydocella thermautotrophica]